MNEAERNNIDSAVLMRALKKSYLVSKADLNGNITYVNEKFVEVSGYSFEELIGQNHSIVSHPKTPTSSFKDLWDTILSKKIWHGVLRNRKKSGESYYVDITIKPILDEDNNIVEFIAIRHEVTELIKKQMRLTKSLRESALLKIPNRFSLFEKLKERSHFLAAQVDIDAFHELNNFFGYEIGNLILKELLKTIQSHIPRDISVYHLQADQFVLLSSGENYEEFQFICKKLQQEIHKKSFMGHENELSILVTVVTSNEPAFSILRSLDMGYEYGKKHEKSFVEYSQECDYSAEYNKNLESLHRVKAAFADDRIIPYYQAIYNNRTNRIEKYEVLARLIDKDGTVLTPYHFLDAVYKSKMNQHLTRVMVRKSFDYFRELPYQFSINLALSDMLNKELVTFIIAQLKKFPDAQRVVFEILESEGIDNFDAVSSFISQVKELGCKIAIDDFGSGYANFENLIKLDADFIKIDGSLIKELDKNSDARDVIDAIGFFARKKQITTIAEFVASQTLMLEVKKLGIDFSQGYQIHEPSAAVKEEVISQEKKFKSLIYVSKSSKNISYGDAQEILNNSFKNNQNNSIYGALVYKDDYFIQCIEGEIETIDKVFEKISNDTRHTDIKIIGEQLSDTFNFDTWNMSSIPNNETINKIFEKNLIGQRSSLYKAQYENMLDLLKDLTKII